jgi:hypothetical protein
MDSQPDEMLMRVCKIAKLLKLVRDSLILTKRGIDPMPSFLTPSKVPLELPEFAHHVKDTEKLQKVFGKLLFAFLFKLWTPLRYAEDLVLHLNMYCCGLEGNLVFVVFFFLFFFF